MTVDLRRSDEWKIHLTMKINFMSSKGSNGKLLMHFKSDNKEIMIGNDTNELIK